MSVDEFVNIDKEAKIYPDISDEQIVECVKWISDGDNSDDQEEECNSKPEPVLSVARDAMKMVIHFIEGNQHSVNSDINILSSFQARLNEMIMLGVQQKTPTKHGLFPQIF